MNCINIEIDERKLDVFYTMNETENSMCRTNSFAYDILIESLLSGNSVVVVNRNMSECMLRYELFSRYYTRITNEPYMASIQHPVVNELRHAFERVLDLTIIDWEDEGSYISLLNDIKLSYNDCKFSALFVMDKAKDTTLDLIERVNRIRRDLPIYACVAITVEGDNQVQTLDFTTNTIIQKYKVNEVGCFVRTLENINK